MLMLLFFPLLLGWCMASNSGSFFYICNSSGTGKKCTDGRLVDVNVENVK